MTSSVQAKASDSQYYDFNQYSGQLHNWSINLISPDNLLWAPVGAVCLLASVVGRVFEGCVMLIVNAYLYVRNCFCPATESASDSKAKTKKGELSSETEGTKGKDSSQSDAAEKTELSKKPSSRKELSKDVKAKEAEKADDTDEVGESEDISSDESDENEASAADLLNEPIELVFVPTKDLKKKPTDGSAVPFIPSALPDSPRSGSRSERVDPRTPGKTLGDLKTRAVQFVKKRPLAAAVAATGVGVGLVASTVLGAPAVGLAAAAIGAKAAWNKWRGKNQPAAEVVEEADGDPDIDDLDDDALVSPDDAAQEAVDGDKKAS